METNGIEKHLKFKSLNFLLCEKLYFENLKFKLNFEKLSYYLKK